MVAPVTPSWGFSPTPERSDNDSFAAMIVTDPVGPCRHPFVDILPMSVTAAEEQTRYTIDVPGYFEPAFVFPRLVDRTRRLSIGACFPLTGRGETVFVSVAEKMADGNAAFVKAIVSPGTLMNAPEKHTIPSHAIKANTRVQTLGSDDSLFFVELGRVYAYGDAPAWRPFLLDHIEVSSDFGLITGFVLATDFSRDTGRWMLVIGGIPERLQMQRHHAELVGR